MNAFNYFTDADKDFYQDKRWSIFLYRPPSIIRHTWEVADFLYCIETTASLTRGSEIYTYCATPLALPTYIFHQIEAL